MGGKWDIAAVAAVLITDRPLNRAMSSKTELRYGRGGSLSIDLLKNTWHDHENQIGGGVLDLIEAYTGLKGPDAFAWLDSQGIDHPERQGPLPPKHEKQKANGNGHDKPPPPTLVARYDYRNEAGEFVSRVARYVTADGDKTFKQRRLMPNREWANGLRAGIYRRNPQGSWYRLKGDQEMKRDDVELPDTPNFPYRLTELMEAIAAERTVFIVEGEKNVDYLWSVGIPATTNLGGAGSWPDHFGERYFKGTDVVIIPDNDPPGAKHAEQVLKALQPHCAKVRKLDPLPGVKDKGSADDWLQDGHTPDELYKLVAKIDRGATGLVAFNPDFMEGFVPPNYLVDGIIQRAFLYSLTARTGSGKTAVALLLAHRVATGAQLGTRTVKAGNVLFMAGENPDDIRARWMVMQDKLEFSDNIHVHWIDGTCKISERIPEIAKAAEKVGGFSLVIVDTAAAFFEGDDANSNTQQGAYARVLRRLCGLPGKPSVVVCCHPVKNAAQDNLSPMGGSAFVNEVDGNLTLWSNTTGTTTLHHQTKLRGPDFDPVSFRLDTVTSERVKDADGRLMPSVMARVVGDTEVTEELRQENRDGNVLLAVLADMPSAMKPASDAELARRCGWEMSNGAAYKQKVRRLRKSLIAEGFLEVRRGRLDLTAKGKREIGRD